MNIQEFAKMLDGRGYGAEMTDQEVKTAKEAGFVIVTGYSDDNAVFRGSINDEAGCFNGGTIYIDKSGIFEECDEKCKYSELAKGKCKTIKAIWHNGGEYSWTYETDIPHATFNIMEEYEKYCKGIVFELKSLEVK